MLCPEPKARFGCGVALSEVDVTGVGVPASLEPGRGRLPVGVTAGRQVPPPLSKVSALVNIYEH